MKRKLKIIFGLGVPLGILLAIVKNILHIGEQEFWRFYVIGSLLAIGMAVLVNLGFQIWLVHKVKTAIKRARDNQDYDQLIREMEQMLKTYKGTYSRSVFKMNICYALAKKEQYQEGLELLSTIGQQTVKGVNRTILFLNQAYFHFYLDHPEEVIAIHKKWEDEFTKLREHPRLGSHVAASKIYLEAAQGHLEQAKGLLAAAEEKWTDEESQEEWSRLREKLAA